MPRGDRSGPAGAGPMTGRGLGYCAGYPHPGFMAPGPGMGMGYGRGRRMRGGMPSGRFTARPRFSRRTGRWGA